MELEIIIAASACPSSVWVRLSRRLSFDIRSLVCAARLTEEPLSPGLRLGSSPHRGASESPGLVPDQFSAGGRRLIGRPDWWASGVWQTCVPSAAPAGPQRAKTKRPPNSDGGAVIVKIKQVRYC